MGLSLALSGPESNIAQPTLAIASGFGKQILTGLYGAAMSEIEIESRSLPLATIGYEASTLPRVIQSLQAASVDLLIDIRAVASSRKAGFSKTLLGASLEAEGIGYRHLRDLGTPKAGRQAARAGRTAQMQSIFNAHMQTDAARGALEQAIEASRDRRVCLMCYEADWRCCHRAIVADLITARTGASVVHLHPEPNLP
jgi:uncharacterized protein (DUF488 family)